MSPEVDLSSTGLAERHVAEFLAAREGARGIDPEVVHVHNWYQLRTSELQALLAELVRLRAEHDQHGDDLRTIADLLDRASPLAHDDADPYAAAALDTLRERTLPRIVAALVPVQHPTDKKDQE